MPKILPIKLNKEPLAEAICQLRVTGQAALNTYAPGLLLAKHPADISDFEQLAAAMLPPEVRAKEPELMFAPLVRLKYKSVLVMFGERSVTVSNPAPYLGWANFKPIIIEVFTTLLESKFITRVDRYSLKYTNVLKEDEKPDSLASLECMVKIGDLALNKKATSVRTETLVDGLVTIISLAGGVTMQAQGQPPIQGSLIDIDTICQNKPQDAVAFMASMSNELDRVRHVNKETFFECLTKEAIHALGPVFDK